MFMCASIVSIGMLVFRRYYIGSELGGKRTSKIISAGLLLFIWFWVVLLNSLNCYDTIGTRQIFVPDVALSAA
jgi:hypothetical protein